MRDDAALRVVKVLHTIAWLFFVACIVGAPLAAATGHYARSAWLVGIVALEGLVLLLNGWVCPLTGIAARYTDRREDNFDIYLPLWLARHNKSIFTLLYLAGAAYCAFAWWRHG